MTTVAAEPPRTGLARLLSNRLLRQNLILFAGGLVAGVGGFVFHAIAGRALGTTRYGEIAALIALYAVLNTPTFIIILVLARYSATLAALGTHSSVRYLIVRMSQLVIGPGLLVVVIGTLLSGTIADFLHLKSAGALIWLMGAVALIWLVAIPRGILQGIQQFPALSANLSLEMVVRCLALAVLLALNTGVVGAVASVLAGCAFAYAAGMFSLRDLLRVPSQRTPLRAMLGFSLTATAGTLGILLLYNLDVILAKHYLSDHQAGIYGGLNKIGTILYFLTLSVSQVLFPRVVEAISKNNHPGRILLVSAGILTAIGAGALAVFLVVPGLVVRLLFGPAFLDATPYIFQVGVIGLALSLNNLLVQFFMAAHDRWFVPILAGAVVVLALTIGFIHGDVGEIVMDVLATLILLLVALTIRCFFLLPHLHPSEEVEATAAA